MQTLIRWKWLIFTFGCGVSLCAAATHVVDSWPTIPPEEWALKDDSLNPGAKALILYREVCNDDVKATEFQHYRIKILTEQGRSYGDVQIPYAEKLGSVENIRARVVQPDGRAVEFSGQIFDKLILKAKKFQVQVKTFTLPEVRPGSVLEYSYVMHWHRKLPDVIQHPEAYILLGTDTLSITHWVLQEELSVRRSRFTLRPAPHAKIVWTSNVLTRENGPVSQPDGSFVFQVDNVPGFPEEELMPPEKSLKTCVDFFYFVGLLHTAQDFWATYIDLYADTLEPFWAHKKVVERVVEATVSSQDSAETKLRKLYACAQQFVYRSQERPASERGETAKPNKNGEEILKRGYGAGNQINLLFIAMVRAAGFPAAPVRVASRERKFFRPNLMDPDQLDALVVWVQVDSQAYYLDPATPYCPFGLLPWEETAVGGYRIEKPGGVYITTPFPKAEDAVIERRGSLQMDDEGNLQGKLQVVFSGQEALERRLAGSQETDRDQRQQLVDEVKSWLPAGSTVKLTDLNRWEQAVEPLRAAFQIRVPHYASSTGRRLLVPLGLFQTPETTVFQNAQRRHPVYFPYPYRRLDEIDLQAPEGREMESVPRAQNQGSAAGRYEISCQGQGGTLHMTRKLTREGVLFPAEEYPMLRTFYHNMRAGDEEQLVLQNTADAHATLLH